MRQMKDSGIEWIGYIPEVWNISSIGKFFIAVAGGDVKPELYSDTKDEKHPYPVYTNTVDASKVYAYTEKPFFKADTITVTGRGYIGRAIYRDCMYDAIIRLISLQPKFDLECRFYTYWIDVVIPFMHNGAAVNQLSASQILPYKIPVLPKQEQCIIADYLDKKCTEIDNAISKTTASIEEYKKLKQAIITKAVTKGIRGNRPMKDSGIEWIGEIPAVWEVNKAFQLFREVKNKNIGLQENNLLSLSYGNIKRKDINTNEGLLPESFEGYNIIDVDNIVLRLTDLQNDHKSLRVGLCKERGIITSAYVTLDNFSNNLAGFLYYQLHAFDVAKGFYSMGGGVRQSLNWDGLKNHLLAIPPIDEQREILRYLHEKTRIIDELVSKKELFIIELEKYKKSLIYEYVTGKKEVV